MNQVEMQSMMPASFVCTSSCVPYQEHVGGAQMTLQPPATHVICSIVGWVSHPWSDPSPISIAARIWNEFYKRYCLFETFYDFVTGCIRLCEASGGNDTGTNARRTTRNTRHTETVHASASAYLPRIDSPIVFDGITDSVRGPSPPRLLARSTIARANWRAYRLSMHRLTKSGQAEFTPSGGEDGGKEEEGQEGNQA